MVAPLWLGPAISAGASLLGGLIGKSSSDDAMKANQKMAAQNIALQKEFAQSGIQWKVEDAKKAGIHPLYAMGSPAMSFSPVSIGATGDTSLASGVAQMGQDVSRAIETTRTMPERDAAYNSTVRALQLRRAGLENELLGAQIAKLRQVGPGLPTPPFAVDIAGNRRLGEAAVGGVYSTNPAVSDAEMFEQRYGDSEVFQTLVGAGVSAADIWSAVKKYAPDLKGRMDNWHDFLLGRR